MRSLNLSIRVCCDWASLNLSRPSFCRLLQRRLVIRSVALVTTRAYNPRLSLCDDILVIMLHGVQLPILYRLINTACVVVGCGLSSHKDF